MYEALDINGKLYQPSEQVALLVGEPIVYIEQLAREKWVDASFVNGRCFVEVESLVRFLANERVDQVGFASVTASQAHYVDVLQTYRTHEAARVPNPFWITFAKTAAVVMCAGLFGFLSWVAVSEKVEFAALQSGVSAMVGMVGESVLGDSRLR